MYFRIERNLVLIVIVWLCGWAKLLDGIIGVISFGTVVSCTALNMTKILAKLRWRYDVLYRQTGKVGMNEWYRRKV